jgi:exodeoxyribonuclease VII small subunit
MSKKDASTDLETRDFETTLKELESLVEQLESGDLGLADSLKHFEQGIRLSRECHQMIDQARQSVEILTQVENEESAEPFDLSQPES